MQHFSGNQTDLTQGERSRRKGTPSQNFFRGESCAAPAAGRRNPVALPPLPRGQRDTGGWFWDFDRGKGRTPSFLGVFPTADKTRRTRPGTEKTAANCIKSAVKRSVFLCCAVKRLKSLRFVTETSENDGKRHKNGVKSCVSRRFSVNPPRFPVCGCVSCHFGEIL